MMVCLLCVTAPSLEPIEDRDGVRTKTVRFDETQTTTSSLSVNLQCLFFTQEDNGKIIERGLIINEERAVAGIITTCHLCTSCLSSCTPVRVEINLILS